MDQIEHASRRLLSGAGATLMLTNGRAVRVIPSKLADPAGPASLDVYSTGRLPISLKAFKPVTRLTTITHLYGRQESYDLAVNLNLLMEALFTYMIERRQDAAEARLNAAGEAGQWPALEHKS